MIALSPADLLDLTIGPEEFRVCIENVADFVAVTGDDPARWTDVAPPGFMATALFAVASDLLRKLSDRTVIHGEQTFSWHRPLVVESTFRVTGTVSRVRERAEVEFVDFDVRVEGEDGELAADASSLFLVSAIGPGDGSSERLEPAPEDRGDPGEGQVAASRADLVRYAAATRDWNPIHWDHATAVAAGLPGVISHGLLQAAWALAAASRLRPGPLPLHSTRIRFRNPLLPAVPVSVSAEEDGDVARVAISDSSVEYLSARVELADR